MATGEITLETAADQPIPVCVINLDRRPDRLAFMARQLDAMGVVWTRVSATDAAAVDDAALAAEVDLETPLIRMGRGSQACAISNFRVFRALAASEAPAALVLQDDSELSPELAGFLRRADWIPPDIGLVQFEKWSRRETSKLLGPPLGAAPVPGREIRRLHSRIGGAGCYLITRDAARRMLAGKARLRFPIDHFLFNLNLSPLSRAVGVAMVCPALARQAWGQLSSDISPGTRAQGKPLAARLRRGLSEINLVPAQLSAILLGGARIRPVVFAERTA
jgi:glycosyl transferase, family 25